MEEQSVVSPSPSSSSAVVRSVEEETDIFIQTHGLDDRVSTALRGLTAEKQTEVMAQSMERVRNASAVVWTRVAALKNRKSQSKADIEKEEKATMEIVDAFVTTHQLDERCSKGLRELASWSQIKVIEQSMADVRNPSAVVWSRIRAAQEHRKRRRRDEELSNYQRDTRARPNHYQPRQPSALHGSGHGGTPYTTPYTNNPSNNSAGHATRQNFNHAWLQEHNYNQVDDYNNYNNPLGGDLGTWGHVQPGHSGPAVSSSNPLSNPYSLSVPVYSMAHTSMQQQQQQQRQPTMPSSHTALPSMSAEDYISLHGLDDRCAMGLRELSYEQQRVVMSNSMEAVRNPSACVWSRVQKCKR